MSARAPRSIVVLGMLTKMPVPGVIWQTVHYLVGLRRLGYDVLYVEAHARTPSMFVEEAGDPGSEKAAAFLRDVLTPHGLGRSWAFHALHHDGAVLGMGAGELARAYRSADLILNLCGGTRPRPEHVETGRMALVITDPVQVEIELWQKREDTRRFLDAHCAVFTFGENYGRPGCELPVSPDFDPFATRQPVLLDMWEHGHPDRGVYTTVANWRQRQRTLRYREEVYHWSKDREFRRFLRLPRRSRRRFELALASYEPQDRLLLEEHGWAVKDAGEFGLEGEPYRSYIQSSRGEFTVAKDQNVRFRSGWFSDRSATYLAAGRPVVTQDTGFGAILPTGGGLFGVVDEDGAVAAIEAIEADYPAACRAARDVARGCFDYRRVLPRMLADVGLEGPTRRFPVGEAVAGGGDAADRDRLPVPGDLRLEPESRRPLRLPRETVHTILARPVAAPDPPPAAAAPPHASTASVVVLTHGQLPLTRLCVESVLAHTRHPSWELVVVDNGSTDGTPDYLRELAAHDRRVRLVLNPVNEGFAAGCNQGARIALGDLLVFLNNDTIVPPGWLLGLAAPLADPSLGAVNPVTNRSGTEAEIGVDTGRTLREFLRRAAERRTTRGGRLRPARMVAGFCLALLRETWDRVGELDEGFGRGLFEDDDYSRRILAAGLELACADGVLVHHFGEASFGELVTDGTYGRLHAENRRRFRRKWGVAEQGRAPHEDAAYELVMRRTRDEVARHVPGGVTVAVVSRGDDRLLELGDVAGWHFPSQDDGTWAGHYPADDGEAVEQLESVRRRGAEYLLVPRPAFWWLDHYDGLRRHLESSGGLVSRSDHAILYRLGPGNGARGGGSVRNGGARPAPRGTSGAPGGHVGSNGTGPRLHSPRGRTSASRPRTGRPHAPGPAPVFIVGSPRSGTSVLTWALGQHPNLYPLEETVWFGRFHAGALHAYRMGANRGERSQLSAMGIRRDEFLETLGTAIDGLILRHRIWPPDPVPADQAYARARTPDDPKARWVDGTPENSFHVDGIVELFPDATFIHLLRRPDLVVRSLRRFHTIGGRQHDTGEAYRKWIAHVRACLEAERTLGPGRVLRVLHEDLAGTPEAAVRACLDFVGEPFAAECLLPLGQRINSSGDAPDPGGAEEGEPDAAVVEEARALEAELFSAPEEAP